MNRKPRNFVRVGHPVDGAVMISMRTFSHLPYLGTIIFEILEEGFSIHIVGVPTKKKEFKLFEDWSTNLNENQKAKITVFAISTPPRERRALEILEYVLNLKSKDPMTFSERMRIIPGFIDRLDSKRKVNVLNRAIKLLSLLPKSILEKLLFLSEIGSRKYVSAEVEQCKPHFLIASPANMKVCKERIWLRECKLRNIPTAIVVLSWDNPTSKGVFLEKPDFIFAQSEFQKEVITNQGFKSEFVIVAGSAHIERLMMKNLKEPGKATPKTRFLFLGSSVRTAVNQDTYLENIVDCLEDFENLEYELIIRPHPKNPIRENILRKFQNHEKIFVTDSDLQFSQEESVDYCEILLQSDCVFGEATSALLEARILGANVYLLNYSKLQRLDERHILELYHSGFIETINNRERLQKVIETTLISDSKKQISTGENWNPRVISDSNATSKTIVNYMVSQCNQSQERNNTHVS
jgi:hypothetical protein